jgi:hypothetical protein
MLNKDYFLNLLKTIFIDLVEKIDAKDFDEYFHTFEHIIESITGGYFIKLISQAFERKAFEDLSEISSNSDDYFLVKFKEIYTHQNQIVATDLNATYTEFKAFLLNAVTINSNKIEAFLAKMLLRSMLPDPTTATNLSLYGLWRPAKSRDFPAAANAERTTIDILFNDDSPVSINATNFLSRPKGNNDGSCCIM